MKAIFNNEILNWEEISLSPSNRGLKYGDGFFETIALINGEPRFLDKHLDRIRNAASILNFQLNEVLNQDRIYKHIKTLKTKNSIDDKGKIRLYVWRNAGGLYCPQNGNADFLLTIEKTDYSSNSVILKVGISEKVVNHASLTSCFKTMSAIKYVIAGIEKNDKKLDEIIILDYRGYISETLSSNIFWKKNNRYYTSPISTGCVEGIMRNQLMNQLKHKGILVEEKLVAVSELLESDSIFTTNSMGFRHIKTMNQINFEVDIILTTPSINTFILSQLYSDHFTYNF